MPAHYVSFLYYSIHCICYINIPGESSSRNDTVLQPAPLEPKLRRVCKVKRPAATLTCSRGPGGPFDERKQGRIPSVNRGGGGGGAHTVADQFMEAIPCGWLRFNLSDTSAIPSTLQVNIVGDRCPRLRRYAQSCVKSTENCLRCPF